MAQMYHTIDMRRGRVRGGECGRFAGASMSTSITARFISIVNVNGVEAEAERERHTHRVEEQQSVSVLPVGYFDFIFGTTS